jgi:hypothetical protein
MTRTELAAAAAAVLLAGCPSFSTMGTARTIPKGSNQFHVGMGGQQLRDWSITDTGTLETITIPAFEVGVSHGVSDSVEVGGKVWFLGAEFNSKFQLHRSEAPTSGVDLALGPALSFYPLSGENNAGQSTSGGLVFVHLPLLLGVNVGGGSQLVITPRLSSTFAWSSASGGGSTSANVLWAGGSLGLALKLGDSFRLLPEISIAYPVTTTRNLRATSDLAFEGAIVTGQLGLVFGG